MKEAQKIGALQAKEGITLPIGQFDEDRYSRAQASDQKKQIEDSAFTQIDLTEFQLTKVNAFARRSMEKALEFLSPGQMMKLKAFGAVVKAPGT